MLEAPPPHSSMGHSPSLIMIVAIVFASHLLLLVLGTYWDPTPPKPQVQAKVIVQTINLSPRPSEIAQRSSAPPPLPPSLSPPNDEKKSEEEKKKRQEELERKNRDELAAAEKKRQLEEIEAKKKQQIEKAAAEKKKELEKAEAEKKKELAAKATAEKKKTQEKAEAEKKAAAEKKKELERVEAQKKAAEEKKRQQERDAAEKKKQLEVAAAQEAAKQKIAKAKESLAKLSETRDKMSGAPSVKLDSTALPKEIASLHVDALPQGGGEASRWGIKETSYSDEVAYRLKMNLKLPDYGEIKIKLTINRSGKVVKTEIVKSESKANKTYIESRIKNIQFSPFGQNFPGVEQNTFIITLQNDS